MRLRLSFCALALAGFAQIQLISAVPCYAEGKLLDRLEASVNSNPVLHSDLQRFRKTLPLRAQLDPLFAGSSLAEKGAQASDEEVTNALIQDLLILSAFPVADAEVEQEIQSIQAANRIDRTKLKSALSQQGFSFENYFELIRISTAKRNLIDRDIRTKVAVTDEDVRAYYLSKVAPSSSPVKAFHSRAIVLSRGNYKSESALRETAERAMAALKSGDAFEEVVARYSDDASKEAGGDLGTLSEDQLSPVIRSALLKLKPGQNSGIVGDPKSALMILQLISITAGEDSRFSKMKEELRNQLAASEYQHQIQLWLGRQERLAFVHRAPPRGK